MATVSLALATKAQLDHFARNVLNLSLPEGATIPQLRAAIIAAHGEADIDAGDAAAPASTKAPGAVAATDTRKPVTIIIPETEQDGASQTVHVAVNGSNMIIPRGQPVTIPHAYLHALQNTIQRLPVTNREGEIVGWRDVPAYPFSIVASAA